MFVYFFSAAVSQLGGSYTYSLILAGCCELVAVTCMLLSLRKWSSPEPDIVITELNVKK